MNMQNFVSSNADNGCHKAGIKPPHVGRALESGTDLPHYHESGAAAAALVVGDGCHRVECGGDPDEFEVLDLDDGQELDF